MIKTETCILIPNLSENDEPQGLSLILRFGYPKITLQVKRFMFYHGKILLEDVQSFKKEDNIRRKDLHQSVELFQQSHVTF